MVDLLRFRDTAGYSMFPDLASDGPITGREACERHAEHTMPFLTAAGGEVVLVGTGGHDLIGPIDERWDVVMLVRHASVAAFLAMAENQEYLAGTGHRLAALEDSRLIPAVDSG